MNAHFHIPSIKQKKIFKDLTLVWFVKDNEKDLKTEECRLDAFRHIF